MKYFTSQRASGFTIVELMIVVLVIAILAAITVVSYNGITYQAHETGVKSNLSTAAKQLQTDKLRQGSYPASLYSLDGGRGIAGSDTVDYTYIRTASGYCLTGVSKSDTSIVFSIDQEGVFKDTACPVIPIPAATNEACFAFNASTRTITDYYTHENNNPSSTACSRDVVIPTTINGVTVEKIGEWSFENSAHTAAQLTSVIIPNSVITIEQQAFAHNKLKMLEIPNGVVDIREGAFNSNELISVAIPPSVQIIDNYAFAGNAIPAVALPKGISVSLLFEAFDSGVTTVTYYTH